MKQTPNNQQANQQQPSNIRVYQTPKIPKKIPMPKTTPPKK